LITLLLTSLCFGQESAYKAGSPILMWKVSSKTNSAYLLGSVHLWDKSMYPLPAVAENAFAASSVLIVEVDMTKVDHQALQQLTMSAGMFPQGDDLNKHITPETRASLNEFALGFGIPKDSFYKYRPWMVALSVVMLPMIKEGISPEDGMDLYFLHKAGNKKVEELETAEFQLKLLSSAPDKDADNIIQHAIKQAESSNEKMAEISRYWSRGEANKLDELMRAMSAEDDADEKAMSHRLREERNPHMTERLEHCLQSTEKCFMVVGAAHAVGAEGIVEQLKRDGYRVEQPVVEMQVQRAN
jgi:hypothetical protein